MLGVAVSTDLAQVGFREDGKLLSPCELHHAALGWWGAHPSRMMDCSPTAAQNFDE